jgi:hypothetical protein
MRFWLLLCLQILTLPRDSFAQQQAELIRFGCDGVILDTTNRVDGSPKDEERKRYSFVLLLNPATRLGTLENFSFLSRMLTKTPEDLMKFKETDSYFHWYQDFKDADGANHGWASIGINRYTGNLELNEGYFASKFFMTREGRFKCEILSRKQF